MTSRGGALITRRSPHTRAGYPASWCRSVLRTWVPCSAWPRPPWHRSRLQWMEPEAVALVSSRGYESPKSKLAMRWSVLLSDALVFVPAALLASRAFAGAR